MKKSLIPFALSALLLAGCGTEANSPEAPTVEPAASAATETTEAAVSETSEPATPSPEAAAETTSAAPEAEKSTRGNLVKEIGEGAGMTDEDGEQLVSFVVNSISIDVPCTHEYSQAPENGHIMVLDISVVTEPALAESLDPTFQFNPYGFTEIAPNGTTSNADLGTMATYSCLPDAEVLPQTIGPGEKVTGKVVLDVTNPSGTLVFKYGGSPSGWEWTYPGS